MAIRVRRVCHTKYGPDAAAQHAETSGHDTDRNHVHTSSGIISMGSFQAQLLHFLASERVVNDTSAQLGYTVPFKLDVVKKYNTELICNSI